MQKYLELLKSVSTQNKYFTWYCNIISNGLSRSHSKQSAKLILGYVEGHHIVPRSFELGGETDSTNLVYLSSKEHIMVHKLLCKFTKDTYRIASLRAYHCMCLKDNGGRNQRKATLYQLRIAKEYARIANSRPRGINGPPKWSKCNTLAEFKFMLESKINENWSDPKIGEFFGVSATAIHNWRKKLNLELRRTNLRDKGWLYEQYVINKLSASEIAEIVGCTGTAVQNYLNKFNIEIRDANIRQKLKNIPKKDRLLHI